MIKTYNINLAGQIFNINEDAYEMMSNYFQKIKQYYANDENKDEIVKDIESRFAEIFYSKGKNHIITIEDAQSVIQQMGNPEEFDSDETTDQSQSYSSSQQQDGFKGMFNKKLYRDMDDRILGGVCSGLSHYFGIQNPLWIRLLFIISPFITFGTALLIYFILLILMPKAETPSQKLEMMGEPINHDAIKNQIYKTSSDIKKNSTINDVVDAIGKIIIIFIKGIILFTLLIFIITFFALAVGAFASVVTGVPLANAYFFNHGIFGWLLGLGLLFTLSMPLVLLIVLTIRLISSRSYDRMNKKLVYLPIIGFFLLGLILAGIGTNNAKKLLAENHEIYQSTPIQQAAIGDSINLRINESKIKNYNELNFNSFSSFLKYLRKNKEIHIPVDIEIYESTDNEYHITREFSAQGENEKEALNNATTIQHSINQNGNTIVIDPNFKIDTKKQKFRNQKVLVKVYVPQGKIIAWNETVENYMDEGDLPIDWSSIGRNPNKNINIKINGQDTDSLKNLSIKVGKNGVVVKANDQDNEEKIEDINIKINDEDDYEHVGEYYIFRMNNGQLMPLE
ncbi:MAG: PspC domain-containing protein [Chitinophagales bacterium]|nr:PspC domain-containing protein [Chitinophagales bacterium]